MTAITKVTELYVTVFIDVTQFTLYASCPDKIAPVFNPA